MRSGAMARCTMVVPRVTEAIITAYISSIRPQPRWMDMSAAQNLVRRDMRENCQQTSTSSLTVSSCKRWLLAQAGLRAFSEKHENRKRVSKALSSLS